MAGASSVRAGAKRHGSARHGGTALWWGASGGRRRTAGQPASQRQRSGHMPACPAAAGWCQLEDSRPASGGEVIWGGALRRDGASERHSCHQVRGIGCQPVHGAGRHLGRQARDLRAAGPVGGAARGLGADGQHEARKGAALLRRRDANSGGGLGGGGGVDGHRPAACVRRRAGRERHSDAAAGGAPWGRRQAAPIAHVQQAALPARQEQPCARAAACTLQFCSKSESESAHGFSLGVVTWPTMASLERSPRLEIAVEMKL